MTDSILAKNLGSFFENATKNITSLDTSNVAPSISRIINNYNSSTNNANVTFNNKQIIDGLNSSNENDKLTILKYLVKLMSTTPNSSNEVIQFYPMIINNINSHNFKIKRYVYMILLKFNHLQQDISLLSINAIQKSLTHKNCINRSLSIRCLAGIKIPAILPILLLSLKKTIKDSSPLVRSSSAIAIIKCYDLDKSYNAPEIKEAISDESSTIYQLYNFLEVLLSDSDPKVLSIALNAYHIIFPEYLDLIHNKIAHLISKLDLLDDYSQSLLIDLVTDYSKLYFPEPSELVVCPELENLLEKFRVLVYSPNPNVILSLTRCLTKLFPFKISDYQIPLVLTKFIKDSSNISYYILNEIHYLLSNNLIQFLDSQIMFFSPLTTDNFQTSKLKILILFKLINKSNFDNLFPQLRFLIEDSNLTPNHKSLIIKNLNTLIISPDQFQKIIRFFLVKLNNENNELLINEYILSLRQLIQEDLITYIDILYKLAGKLINAEEEQQLTSIAKSSIIWLLGEFAINYYNYNEHTAKVETLFSYLPDLFRILTTTFKEETQQVKLDILSSLTKLVALELYHSKQIGSEYNLYNNTLWKLLNYVLQLTKYDSSLDLRDRSRLVGSILPNVTYQANTTSQQLNIDGLLSITERECSNKLSEIELSILILHSAKPKPTNRTTETSEFDSAISKFNEITNDKLDLDYLDYYNELRSSNFTLHDYTKYNNSISSSSNTFKTSTMTGFGQGGNRTGNDSSGSNGGLSSVIESGNHSSYARQGTPSSTGSFVTSGTNVKRYRLQTLDDFLSDAGNGSNKVAVFGGEQENDEDEDEDDETEAAEQGSVENEESDESNGDYEYEEGESDDEDEDDDQQGLLKH